MTVDNSHLPNKYLPVKCSENNLLEKFTAARGVENLPFSKNPFTKALFLGSKYRGVFPLEIFKNILLIFFAGGS